MEKFFVGLDVSETSTSICIVNQDGKIVNEMTTPTIPQSINSALHATRLPITEIGLETGSMSNRLVAELRKLGWNVKCLDAYKMSILLKISINKTDKIDARVIAEVIRNSSFSLFNIEVHVKSIESQEIRSLTQIRQQLIWSRTDTYNTIRGTLKNYGVQEPTAKPPKFCSAVRETIKNLSPLMRFTTTSALAAYETIHKGIEKLSQKIDSIANESKEVQILKKQTGIGNVIALEFKATIDDPKRFKSSKSVGAYLGMTPSEYSSGQSKKQNGISKRGDKFLRSLLYEAATTVLYRSKEKSQLKKWGLNLVKKIGSVRARVAVGRKIAIRMHVSLITGKPFEEKPQKSKCNTKPECLEFGTKELQLLAAKAEKNGCVRVRNIKQLKELAIA